MALNVTKSPAPTFLTVFRHAAHYVNASSVKEPLLLLVERSGSSSFNEPGEKSAETSHTLLSHGEIFSFSLGKGFPSRLNAANIAHNEKQDYHSDALCLPRKRETGLCRRSTNGENMLVHSNTRLLSSPVYNMWLVAPRTLVEAVVSSDEPETQGLVGDHNTSEPF